MRSYLLKDGRLHLPLMADGGILAWEPLADVEFEETADQAIGAGILAAFPSYTRSSVGTGDAAAQARYAYNRVDLNGDGQEEVLAYVTGRGLCGTGGCTLLLLAREAKGYRVINSFPVSRLPFTVSPQRTGGWNNLVRLESGGGAPASHVTHAFDGTRYVERGRTPANAVPQGTRYLAGELGPGTGATLTWRSATSATATFAGMVPLAVTVSTTGGVTKFVLEDRVYFWVSDRRAAADELKTLK